MSNKNVAPLSPTAALNTFRQYRHSKRIDRGEVQQEKLTTDVSVVLHWQVLAIILFGGLIFSLLYGVFVVPTVLADVGHAIPIPALLIPFKGLLHGSHLKTMRWVLSIVYGYQTGIILALLFLFWPIMRLFLYALLRFRRPTKGMLRQYSSWHQIWAFLILAFVATCIIYPRDAMALWHTLVLTHGRLRGHTVHHHDPTGAFFLTWGVLWIILTSVIPLLLPNEQTTSTTKQRRGDFSLYLGQSTGDLIKRNHVAGMSPAQRICLSAQDAALNILILGGIGEGKTTGAINTLLLQLLDQDCGGLIFDVKGTFHEAVTQFATLTDTKVITVGPGHQRINLIGKLKPEVAADIMSAIFLMFNSNNQSAFWITQAANLCRGAFGLLAYFPEHYTLDGLRQYIFEEAFRDNIDCLLSNTPLSERDIAIVKSYRSSLAMFLDCPERMQGDIRATASSALSQFTHPDIKASFCSHTDEPLHLEQVLDGNIFLVDMPKSEYGQLSRTIHAVIKLRWFHVMEARRRHEDWDQDRMVFFMCDEYQDLVTADPAGGSMSDLSFWDKARDTKAIGIISAQSMSSFYSAIGDRDMADTVLQNFRQRLCFKTEDEKTIQHLQRITGDVMVANRSQSRHKGQSHGAGKSHTSTSSSESLSQIRQHVIDSQLMRLLEPNQVIALLNVAQRSMDDVLRLQPVFLDGSGR